MSGGRFDYAQDRIQTIIDDLELIIERNGRAKTDEELKYEDLPNWYYENHPEARYHNEYSGDILNQFIVGLALLKRAYIYAQRIDWFLSGDDGEDSFLARLEEDLNNIK